MVLAHFEQLPLVSVRLSGALETQASQSVDQPLRHRAVEIAAVHIDAVLAAESIKQQKPDMLEVGAVSEVTPVSTQPGPHEKYPFSQELDERSRPIAATA